MESFKSLITSKLSERDRNLLLNAAKKSGSDFANSLTELDQAGILALLLPEITQMKAFKHDMAFHPEGDVFQHTMAALRANKLETPIINLAILLHDVGKILTYEDKDGIPTYHGHAQAAKELVDAISDRLDLSEKEREAILFAALHHMSLFDNVSMMKPKKIYDLVNNENWEVLKAVMYADAAARQHLFNQAEHDKIIAYVESTAKEWGEKTANKVIKLVDGQHVMDLTGLSPGPLVGKIIKEVSRWIMETGTKDEKDIDKYIMLCYNNMR